MKQVFVNGVSLYEIVFYFFIYGFLGWCCEVVFAALKHGKFVNRGFLNGTICPIYGVGVVLLVVALDKVDEWYWVLLASIGIATVLEFATGWVLGKIFHKKWWDYSKEPFNVMGYICPRMSLLWGFACLFVDDLFHPLIRRLVTVHIESLPQWVGYTAIGIFSAIIIADFIVTLLQIKNLNGKFKAAEKLREELRKPSDFVGKQLSAVALKASQSEAMQKLKNHLDKLKEHRLTKAYPNLLKDKQDKSDGENKTSEK
ncbi:MAG: putative ABC transporter permease [Corallococcus sp.]|nr:putative ABC transporter permease [Corallococcus sp.]